MVAVVRRPGSRRSTPPPCSTHCQGKIAHFAVPRYVRFMDALPKNHAERVQKFELRAAGVTPTTRGTARPTATPSCDRAAHAEVTCSPSPAPVRMGSTFGGYLARAGHDVTLVDVDADHIDAVTRHGLVLRHADGRKVDGPTGRDDVGPATRPRPGRRRDRAVQGLGQPRRRRVDRGTPSGRPTWVATLQNGLGNDEALAAVLGPERVLPGTTTAGAHKPEPGVVDVSPITSSGSLDHPARSTRREPGDPGRRRRPDRRRSPTPGCPARCWPMPTSSSGRSWPWPRLPDR